MIDWLRVGELVFWFLVLWIPVMGISHELCHALECKRQSGKPEIKFWWHKGIPSMLCECSELTMQKTFLLAGGVYNAFLLLGLGFLLLHFIYMPLGIIFYIYGIIQGAYGIYESRYRLSLSLNTYMRWKNIVYLIGFGVGFLLTYNYIWSWING